MDKTDIVVVGAGHAGCEAALAASRLGAKVVVVTLRIAGIAQMSCNPAIGGVGKGHLVREIDALGGAMGQVADATGIQFRRLNMSRGPAVRSTRAQADATLYRETMANRLLNAPGVTVVEDEVVALTHTPPSGMVITTAGGRTWAAGAAIITTGTFLRAQCHVGEEQFVGGRLGDKASGPLSAALKRLGLKLGRFKTGTTPRLATSSIDWSALEPQLGDTPRPTFSFEPVGNALPQLPCHIGYTTAETHAIVQNNLGRSPLYQGIISGIGPRYCPSLEDKVVRFAAQPRHQIFFEPETLSNERIYPAGLSTSLPKDVQDAFLRSIPGLQNVRVLAYGYAVEYDFAHPTQLTPALMAKGVPGLFLAGQINGSSGYEEAAAQGLLAGLNAVRHLGGQQPAVLGRDEAYMGVLVDDLVTQGVDEPYRIFTSRAEHRLTLRESNAESRLLPKAAAWGLLDAGRESRGRARLQRQQSIMAALGAPVGAPLATALNLPLAQNVGASRLDVLRRPEIALLQVLPEMPELALEPGNAVAVEESAKYAGYIAREARTIEGLRAIEAVSLPQGFDFAGLNGLSRELQEKLHRVAPTTLGQASRIPGMTPTALALLQVHGRGEQAISS